MAQLLTQKYQRMGVVVLIFNLLFVDYWHDYVLHALSSTQKLIYCGYTEDSELASDSAETKCRELIEDVEKNHSVLAIGRVPEIVFKETIEIANKNDNLWLLVLEQTTITQFRHLYTRHTEDYRNVRFIHYSEANARNLFDHNLALKTRHYHLPFLPCSSAPFERYRNQPKLFDVAFVGNRLFRRQALLDNISPFFNVNLIEAWGETRDNLIAQSKVLINVHNGENHRILESLRCVPALMLGTVVVSEKSFRQTLSDVEKQIRFSSYYNLLDELNETLRNFDLYDGKLKEFLRVYSPSRYLHCRIGFALSEMPTIEYK